MKLWQYETFTKIILILIRNLLKDIYFYRARFKKLIKRFQLNWEQKYFSWKLSFFVGNFLFSNLRKIFLFKIKENHRQITFKSKPLLLVVTFASIKGELYHVKDHFSLSRYLISPFSLCRGYI